MRACSGASTLATAAALLAAWSCQNDPPPPTVASATSAPPPSAAPAEDKPWFAGTWAGTFSSKPHRIDLDRKSGAPREWVDETREPRGAGEVKMSLQIDDQGATTGSASGALGSVSIVGAVQDDILRARVVPLDPDAFSGTLIAERRGDTLSGNLNASSGDSLSITKSELVLTRASAP